MSFKQLGLFITVFVLSFSALSEEKANQFKLLPKDVYFVPGGGIRVRYDWLRDATGQSFSQNEDDWQATHRAQLDFKLYKGEYFETFFRLLNVAEWGSSTGDSSGGQHDGFSRNNGILVNQAWALWKIDESLGIVFGRAPIHLGLGYTYGNNDWFNVPYSFDQFNFKWDWQSVELTLIAAKVQELTTVPAQTLSPDPEEIHYIVNMDFKEVADVVNVLNFHLVQVNRDLGSPDGGASVLNGLNMQRLALDTEITGQQFFATAFITYVTGEEKIAPVNRVSGITNVKINQLAFDFKLGYSLPQSNDLRFWAGYHFDSGDGTADDEENRSYDSLYYEVYGQSGLMDLLRWGNLSFYRVGFDVSLVTDVTLGAEWMGFSKTEESDNLNFGRAGRFFESRVSSGDITFNDGKNIGSEFDIWLDWKFHSGVEVRTTLSAFLPGDVFENATTTSTGTPSSTITQVLSQVGFYF